MNYSELVSAVAERAYVTRGTASDIVNAVFNEIMDNVVAGNTVQIHGFGTFSPTKRRGFTGRNAQSGETIDVPPKRSVSFKAGATFKGKFG